MVHGHNVCKAACAWGSTHLGVWAISAEDSIQRAVEEEQSLVSMFDTRGGGGQEESPQRLNICLST